MMQMERAARPPAQRLRHVEIVEAQAGLQVQVVDRTFDGPTRIRARQDDHLASCAGQENSPVPPDGKLRPLVRFACECGKQNLQVAAPSLPDWCIIAVKKRKESACRWPKKIPLYHKLSLRCRGRQPYLTLFLFFSTDSPGEMGSTACGRS